ncbi:MAG: hypothetical protein CBARDMAM_6339 [uncultured Caballeronia sp.]|nr:MAG: hypothetical protein CBARDMAM_6339 [uncultured Caballeronia sp.]
MNLYFMNQREAIRYLLEVRRKALAKPGSDVIVKTHLREIPGVKRVLFVECGSGAEDRIVFII